MKAWIARVKDDFFSTVVFAETIGKAKSLALATECCEDADFTDIEIRRIPNADKYYKDGKTEMEWFDDNDRIALVKDCGFTCEYVEEYECENCSAKEYCEDYINYCDEKENENAEIH